MPNLGELNSYLCDHNLTEPPQDDWESFRLALTTFLDCWYGGGTITTEENKLTVEVDGERIMEMEYTEGGEWPLFIKYGEVDDRFGYRLKTRS